jgi:hypothetical protein
MTAPGFRCSLQPTHRDDVAALHHAARQDRLHLVLHGGRRAVRRKDGRDVVGQPEEAVGEGGGEMIEDLKTWAELFPEGRDICYEGDDPEEFVAEIVQRFGFDPSADPRWETPWLGGDSRNGLDPFGRTHWFVCPPEHLDAIYGTDDYRTGS